MTTPIDPELHREREHLRQAREAMVRMRADALYTMHNIKALEDTTQFHLERRMWERSKSLVDDGTSALFFGRLDGQGILDGWGGTTRYTTPALDTTSERYYFGKRHLTAEDGTPLVLDWRAPISVAFYRATPDDARGVTRRRRFGFDHGEISAFEDERMDVASSGPSALLAAEIERPRVGPMRDIVATIQPEQDALVRVDDTTTVCVQGAPGTGKTAVGLHRIAWLLYAFRDRLSRGGVLVVGPNRAFLDHIGHVLPALGEVQVEHTTAEELVGRGVKVRGVDTPEQATLKGDARMAELLRRAVWDRHDPTTEVGRAARVDEPLLVPRGSRKWRVPAYQVRDILSQLAARGIRYDAARQLLPQRLAHEVLVLMEESGDSPDDRVQDAVARSAPVKAYAQSVWPQVKPADVLFRLYADAAHLAATARGLFTDAELALLSWPRPPRSAGTAKWTLADATLLDEIADLLERTPSLAHVMLDEAQDLSPMQLRAVGRRCSTGAATVLGDIAQGTTPWATSSWAETLTHLGQDRGHVEELTRGFRVPAAVIEYAARLLPSMAAGLRAPESVRSNRGLLRHVPVAPEEVADAVVTAVREDTAQPGSVGVIVPDADVDTLSAALTAAGIDHGVLGTDHGDVEHQVDVVPATVAKGLEFDRVIVVEPTAIAAAEPDERTGLRRLYVVLTRAVSALTVVHSAPLPAALATSSAAPSDPSPAGR